MLSESGSTFDLAGWGTVGLVAVTMVLAVVPLFQRLFDRRLESLRSARKIFAETQFLPNSQNSSRLKAESWCAFVVNASNEPIFQVTIQGLDNAGQSDQRIYDSVLHKDWKPHVLPHSNQIFEGIWRGDWITYWQWEVLTYPISWLDASGQRWSRDGLKEPRRIERPRQLDKSYVA